MSLFRASLETPNFSFEAYAETEVKAMSVLRRGWNIHRNQYGKERVQPFKYFAEDAHVYPIKSGAAFRDHEIIRKPRSMS